MSRIISIHSYRGGTGKSNTSANVAAQLAAQGMRVAVIDTDLASPGVHVLFGLTEEDMTTHLNGYLYDEYPIADAVHDMTGRLGVAINGRLFLIPASIDPADISNVVRNGYDVEKLTEGFDDLLYDLDLDVLIVDTHPGINDETLLSIAVSDALALILRPDQQDYQGTHVTVQIAKKLRVPQLALIVNKAPLNLNLAEVKTKVEQAYDAKVVAVFPHSDDLMGLASAGIFSLHFPDHPFSATYRELADTLMD